jgi:hypothetical protein
LAIPGELDRYLLRMLASSMKWDHCRTFSSLRIFPMVLILQLKLTASSMLAISDTDEVTRFQKFFLWKFAIWDWQGWKLRYLGKNPKILTFTVSVFISKILCK